MTAVRHGAMSALDFTSGIGRLLRLRETGKIRAKVQSQITGGTLRFAGKYNEIS
jgi:hypothetical protein